MTFAALGVPRRLVDVLTGQGITAPFPVQTATLPDGLAGRDILGRAQTGSGKTLGFSLPLVARLTGRKTVSGMPRGLVLVPTRELATQVSTVLKPLARAMDLWVTTIYGGVAYGPQVNALHRRTDIVVATPGRLADLIGQGECDLANVEITVIDEADQMADLGFLPIVRRLLETTPSEGQRMLFSATLDAAVDVLARRFLHNAVLHSVDENSSPAEIEHHVLTIEPGQRVEVVAALTGGEKRSLVFTRTKHGAERLARQLTGAGIPAAELHGNLRQGARARNLAAFSSHVAKVMVATDIAARGIHIDGIDLVIHADPPAEHKAYVHRSGRTARGGADGVVVTLQTRAQVRDVTAMMVKAGITPHDTVAVTPDSAELREMAGAPAARVAVDGKVGALVQPEDRLAANDRPGGRPGGRPGQGRPRGDRNRSDDRGRERPRPFRRDDGGPSFSRSPGSGRPQRFNRDQQDGPFARDGRDAQDGRPARDGRAAQDTRPQRVDRGDRPARVDRDDRPARDDRDGLRPARFDRDNRAARDDRPRPAAQDERAGQFNRDDRAPRRDRRDGAAGAGRAVQRGGYDWYPRTKSQGDNRKPGTAWRSFGNPDRNGASRDGGPARNSRPVGNDRAFGSDRQPAAREGRQSGRGSGGAAGRSGYPATGNQVGKRRTPGQGRHY